MERHRFIHTGETHFECQFCGKRFIQKSTLKAHLVVHLNRNRTFSVTLPKSQTDNNVCEDIRQTIEKPNLFGTTYSIPFDHGDLVISDPNLHT